VQQQADASRTNLGTYCKRFTRRPHGCTSPTARAGGLHTIQHAYQAHMPPTHEPRAACCISRVEVAECSSRQARHEPISARTVSASRVVRTAARRRRHVQAGCTRSNMLTQRRCRQLASYVQPDASAVWR